MVKIKLISKASGISAKSGKPWCRVTFGADQDDGTRNISEFFVNPEVAAKVASIQLDSTVYVSAGLDNKLHFEITDIQSANISK